jgi:hypothetical protein
MEFDTSFSKYSYSKRENKKLSKIEHKFIRLRVLSDEVSFYKATVPLEYRNLLNRYTIDDHRVFLRVGCKCIGFMVSPYNLHSGRHKALQMEGHTVFEIRQQHHINAETLVVLKDEYANCVIWKKFELK